MSGVITSTAFEALKLIISPTGYAISKILEKSGNEISESTANIDELNDKAKRVEIESKALFSSSKSRARVIDCSSNYVCSRS
ncbi:Uncharacterised protein [Providencia alcalifaciens]|nr:Uncharacterised protein [Providencia alcalifaciens]